jgi:hypothetical protein
MSDTPKLADECIKLLDNGWCVTMYKNAMGSYTARAASFAEPDVLVETDDFTPSQVLYRLTEKVFGRIA